MQCIDHGRAYQRKHGHVPLLIADGPTSLSQWIGPSFLPIPQDDNLELCPVPKKEIRDVSRQQMREWHPGCTALLRGWTGLWCLPRRVLGMGMLNKDRYSESCSCKRLKDRYRRRVSNPETESQVTPACVAFGRLIWYERDRQTLTNFFWLFQFRDRVSSSSE